MKTNFRNCLPKIGALFFFALLGVGCGDSSDSDPTDEEGCEHLSGGPVMAISGTENPAAMSPPASNDHKRYDVALTGTGDARRGSVKFQSSVAGDYVFFVNQTVPFFLLDASTSPITLKATAGGSSACSEIRGRHVATLGVGTYYLTFGPTAQSTVGLVIEEVPAE